MGSTGDHHVALIAFPFSTHAAPLFSLATALATAAPSTTFSFINSARSNVSLSKAISSVPSGVKIRVYDLSDGCPEGYIMPAHDPEEEVRLFLKVANVNVRNAIEKAVEGSGGIRVSCIIGENALPSRANEPLDCIPYMSPLQVRELPEGIVFGNLESVFARLLHRMAEALPSATAVALNTFQGLDPALDNELSKMFKLSLPIGPLHLLTQQPPELADTHGCVQWLDTHAPATVVYISFGSIMSLPPPEAVEVAEGLEASGVPFIWSMKPAAQAQLPQGFLDRTRGRGMVVSWAPQLQVLGHSAVGAFVTHCGWNSIMESVTAGVPMICRPFIGDQRLNAGVLSRVWKIGVGFEGRVVTRETVEMALTEVLKEEGGRKMKERVGELREMAIRATQSGGSSSDNLDALVEVIFG